MTTTTTTTTATTNEDIIVSLTQTVVVGTSSNSNNIRVVEHSDADSSCAPAVISKSLRLLVLGCQPVAPYGPNQHTAQLLLEKSCPSESTRTTITNTK